MLITLSPAKTLDFTSHSVTSNFTQARMLESSSLLNTRLRELGEDQLSALMKISESLAVLNRDRNLQWSLPFTPQNAKQSLLAFQGGVYQGLKADTFSDADFHFAQYSLRILSGLYGLLRPLDLIQPYRLEMGTKLENSKGKDLYDFWDSSITDLLNEDLESHKEKIVVNLASAEYFKSVKSSSINGRIVTPVFKERKAGKLRTLAVFAKPARGMMSSYIIKNKLEDVEGMKTFDYGGYAFDDALSTDDKLVFTRDQP